MTATNYVGLEHLYFFHYPDNAPSLVFQLKLNTVCIFDSNDILLPRCTLILISYLITEVPFIYWLVTTVVFRVKLLHLSLCTTSYQNRSSD